MTLFVTRGLPGSGKTTRALAWLAESPTTRARVNRDAIREHVFGLSMLPGDAVLDAGGEAEVTDVQEAMVTALLATRLVVVDDTNLSEPVMGRWRTLATARGVALVVWDLRDVPLEVCIARDAARAASGGRSVGEEIIRTIAAKGATTYATA